MARKASVLARDWASLVRILFLSLRDFQLPILVGSIYDGQHFVMTMVSSFIRKTSSPYDYTIRLVFL